MGKYFVMTKFGMKKTGDYVPSDKYMELKDGTYAVQNEFFTFFKIDPDSANLTIEKLYDAFIACLNSKE
jgi:hypothetical protein